MSSNVDKYLKDFEAPPDAGEPGGLNIPTITADDLNAVETRINRHIAESIERLDAKITKAITTDTTSAGQDSDANNENESEE